MSFQYYREIIYQRLFIIIFIEIVINEKGKTELLYIFSSKRIIRVEFVI